jgi:hypothetical protein
MKKETAENLGRIPLDDGDVTDSSENEVAV